MMNEVERIWKEVVMAQSRYCPIIFIRGTENNYENCWDGKFTS
jgi:hypothetical protein